MFVFQKRCWFSSYCLAGMLALLCCGCPPGQPPIAAFRATPTGGDAPLQVTFSDVSLPGSAEIDTWFWNFGDGYTSLEQHPMHCYTQEGNYTVSLAVNTAAGEDTAIKGNYIRIPLQFKVHVYNTGDYPVGGLYIVSADALDLGHNLLAAWLSAGDDVALEKSFRKGQHIVVVVFDMNGQARQVVFPKNMDTSAVVGGVLRMYVGVTASGEVETRYDWP